MYHFYPGTKALTFSTWSCNFTCPWCQNWVLSKSKPDPSKANYISPGEMIDLAIKSGCQGLSVSFTEPTLLFEYSLDVFPLALNAGLYTNFVSNGYMTVEALKMLRDSGLQSIKIDVKGGLEAVKRFCGADVSIVWRNAELAKKMGVHVEIVNLIIPGVNDDEATLREIIENHVKRLGVEVPIHFTAYYPTYEFKAPPTPVEKLEEAYRIAKSFGVKYPYV
ncbi:MAG: radical SAM protein, partial [Candidatus Bathyarchaeia archaeon]